MGKIDIDDKLIRLIKAEALKRNMTIKQLVTEIMMDSISKDTLIFCGETYKSTKKEVKKPASKKPKTTDKKLTLTVLLELQRLLSEGLEPTNKELVANIPEIKNAGPILKQHGVNPKHKNRARRYTADLLPIVEKAIEDLKKRPKA